MTTYYTAILLMTYMTLIAFSALVHTNGRISREEKRGFDMICGAIMLATFWEWLGVRLNGAPAWSIGLHRVAKCMDYIFTPLCSVFFAHQISPSPKREKILKIILAGNAVMQLVSVFTGWSFYVDAENFYHRSVLYPLYMIISIGSIVFVVIAFVEYARQFERQNREALIAILCLLGLGIILQEIIGGEVRTTYLGMAISTVMLFIHFTEFNQVRQDATVRRQDALLATDAQTGVLSRFAYKQVIADYGKNKLPSSLTAFEVDLNGLKAVNDLVGHEAGDELLSGTGEVLNRSIGPAGQVFRIGGDEFVILLDTQHMTAERAVELLRENSAAWQGKEAKEMSLSIGCASAAEFPDYDIVQLVHEADQRMYLDKDRYYSMPGHERRRGPRGNAPQQSEHSEKSD